MKDQEPHGSKISASLLLRSPAQLPPELGMLRQIEELKCLQIELELQVQELQAKQQESEVLLQHYTSLFDGSPVGFVCLDHLGRIRQANQAAADLLQGERSRLLGAYLTQFIAREGRDPLRQLVRRAQPGQPAVAAGIQLRHRQAPFYFLAQAMAPLPGAEPLCQVAILEPSQAARPASGPVDAGQRPLRPAAPDPAAATPDPAAATRGHAQAEQFIAKLVQGLQVPQEQLLAQVHLVRAWLEAMPEGVVLCDAGGKILFINSPAAFLLADLIEHTPVISCAADCWEVERYYHADRQTPYSWEDFPMQRVLKGERLDEEQLWISSPGGYGQQWLLFSGSPLRDHEGALCGAVFILRQERPVASLPPL